MMGMRKSLVLLCLMAQPFMVHAGSFDYRHEYKHHTQQHGNRLKLSYSTDSFYYGGQVKFATEKNPDGSQEAFGRLEDPEAKLDVGTHHQINQQWYLRPGIRAGGGKGFHTTDLQARLGYSAKALPLKTYVRYRRSVKNIHQSDKKNTVTNKLTFSLTYKQNANRYWLKTHWIQAETKPVFDDKKTNYEYMLGVGRKFNQWLLYMEMADIKAHGDTATRQLRTRVGIKYDFDK